MAFKKIKDLTEEEIKEICNRFDYNCEIQLCQQLTGVCPLKTSTNRLFGKCVLKTKAWEIINNEVEL